MASVFFAKNKQHTALTALKMSGRKYPGSTLTERRNPPRCRGPGIN